MTETPAETERRVTPLELFFDLVFVFGFTQVTTLLYEDRTWQGLARALLALALLWWAWAAYAWLTNAVDANAGPVVATILVATGAMFLAALALPDAFGRHAVLFAGAFVVVLAMWIVLFALATMGEPDVLAAVLRSAPLSALGGGLVLTGAVVGGGLRPWLWLVAVLAGFLAPGLNDVSGWRVRPAHFSERHGLIVIIAIGESLVAIGLAARNTALDGAVVGAVLLGLGVAASLWLAYFDFFSIALQELLWRRDSGERAALARDAYTYLHLPMIAGIVLFAAAMRVTVSHPHATLATIPALALCLGPALYLGGYVALAWRVARRLSRGRATATAAFVLCVPIALHVPALAALGLCTALVVALHGYELVWWREERARRRAVLAPEPEPTHPAYTPVTQTGNGPS